MAYSDYEYYTDTYCGGNTGYLTSAEFTHYERLSQFLIKQATLEKSDECTDEILKVCDCAIAEQLKAFDVEDKYNKGSAMGVTSEKVGEYSVNYGGITAQELESVKEKEIRKLLNLYLGMTGLLYRGA